ncbi:MAG: hypothetical protein KH847_06555, partial [Clostridiales bacterium]|nr:hypothetical protein [Clostridiales bacterium]
KKDGQVVGEVIQEDEVKRLATVNGIWSQIYYKKENGKRGIGYIPTSVLIRLADHYGTSIDYLLGHTDRKEPYPPKKSRRVRG